MKKIDYLQTDERWDDIPYPRAPYTVATSGCGPTTVANLVCYLTGKKITPEDTAKYMKSKGYAIYGQGTLWDGMPKTFKHYGLVDKEYSTVQNAFFDCFKHKTGYFLFRNGKCGTTVWTQNGHYVAFEDYKVENGRHYFWTCDSGNRNNDGWHSYEGTMKGLVKQIHTVHKQKEKRLKGFDISYVQNGLDKKDFQKAKKAGWDFCIIRIGTILNGKMYTDKEFKSKYKNAKAAKLTVGAYWYGMAKDTETAKKEARYVLKQLNGKKLTYPIFYDFEDPSLKNIGKEKSKKICEAFCEVIKASGYRAGVYASYDWFVNRIGAINSKYYIWLAQYPKATYKGRYNMHQYSSAGKVDGIGSKIDVNTSKIKPQTTPLKTFKKLKMGSRGSRVKKLQEKLRTIGYNINVDGVYGTKTKNAIKAFQIKYNVNNGSGIYGSKTAAKLKLVLKKKQKK